MIEVTGPDGKVHNFADGTPSAQIDAAMLALYPATASPPPSPAIEKQSGAPNGAGRVSTMQIVAGALVAAVVTLVVAMAFLLGRGGNDDAGKQKGSTEAAPSVATNGVAAGGLAVAPEAFSGFISTQEGGVLNVRNQPSMNAMVIAKLPHGAPVSVTGSIMMADGMWRQVNVAGVAGFVRGDYVSQTQPSAVVAAPVPQLIPIGMYGTALTRKSDTVNMRATPSLSGRTVGSIPYGASVFIVGQQGTWYLVEWGGQRGWASTDYIRR